MGMRRAKATVDKVVGGVLVVLMAASVLNVLWQVFTRFVLESPSSFTEELARYLLIWIGVLGSGYAVGQRAHLALELLPGRLDGRQLRALNRFIQGCIILFAALVMVLGGLRLVYVQLYLGQTSPSLGLPLGWVYLVIPVSGLLMIFYAALQMRDPDLPAAHADAPPHAAAPDAGTAPEAERPAAEGTAPGRRSAARDGRSPEQAHTSTPESNPSSTES